MFDFTKDILDLALFIIKKVWVDPLFLGFCGFFILSFIATVFHELVGFYKC